MTAPNLPPSQQQTISNLLKRVAILEATVGKCCPDWQDIVLDNEPYVECPTVGQCLQYANNCCGLQFQGMLRDGNDQPTSDELVGTLPVSYWPDVDYYTVIPFEMNYGSLVPAVLYVAAADGEVRVQWGN